LAKTTIAALIRSALQTGAAFWQSVANLTITIVVVGTIGISSTKQALDTFLVNTPGAHLAIGVPVALNLLDTVVSNQITQFFGWAVHIFLTAGRRLA